MLTSARIPAPQTALRSAVPTFPGIICLTSRILLNHMSGKEVAARYSRLGGHCRIDETCPLTDMPCGQRVYMHTERGAYSGDREQQIHAMVNSAWNRQLEFWFLRQVFTIRQGSRSVCRGRRQKLMRPPTFGSCAWTLRVPSVRCGDCGERGDLISRRRGWVLPGTRAKCLQGVGWQRGSRPC